MSHVKLHFALHTPHFTLHTAFFALHTSHFTLHSSHSKLHTPHSTLLTSHSTLHTPHFTLHASHFSLLSSDSTLHTSHFTRHSPHFNTSHCFLHTPHTSSLHREAFTHSKLSHTASIYTQNTYTQCFLHMASAYTHTHRNFYTEKLLHTANFYTQQAFTHSKRLHTVLAHSAFTHGKRLHTEHLHTVLLHMASVYTHTHQKKLLHRDTFNTCTDKLLHTANFYTQHLLHTASFHTQQAFRHRTLTHSTCTQCFYTWQAFTHKLFHTGKQLQNRISTPKQKKDDFEALVKRDFKRKITSAKIAKICWQITIAAWMQPLQYDLQSSAAKDNSITHAAAAASNLEAATPMRSAETELQITIELSATASEIAAPKPDISTPKQKKDDFEAFFKRNFKRKITSAKIAKICWQMTIAAWMQPLQYDLQSSAAKDNSITHAAAAASNLDAAIPMRSASTDSKTPYNYAHTSTPKAAWSHRYNAAKKKGKPTAAAPAAQTKYLSSPAAATLHGKTQGFVLRLPPENRALATSCSHSNAIWTHRFQNTL